MFAASNISARGFPFPLHFSFSVLLYVCLCTQWSHSVFPVSVHSSDHRIGSYTLTDLIGCCHTHASLLMEQGVSIDTISRHLGHADSQITREIYLHVTKKLQEKENEQLKGLKIIWFAPFLPHFWNTGKEKSREALKIKHSRNSVQLPLLDLNQRHFG